MSTMEIYQNKRNGNKYIEIHNDGHSHYSVRQYIKTMNHHKPQYVGDGCLHRWSKVNLDDLLEDYKLVRFARKTLGGSYEILEVTARNEDGYYDVSTRVTNTYGDWYCKNSIGKMSYYREERNPREDALRYLLTR